jgi:hypothetical protein
MVMVKDLNGVEWGVGRGRRDGWVRDRNEGEEEREEREI